MLFMRNKIIHFLNIQVMINRFFKVVFALPAILFCFKATAQSTIEYDIVLSGGRVIDPETKLDAIRNVGILNHRIAQISSEQLKGKETINVTGLVVAPGFIDMHAHGRTNKEQEYQMHDGVTTGLELEWGVEHLGKWYASRKDKALINYGASVCWPFERFLAIGDFKKEEEELMQTMANGQSGFENLLNKIKPANNIGLSQSQIDKTIENIKQSLAEGGIGIGMPLGYVPGSKPEEVFRIFQMAASVQALIYTHVREGGLMAVEEVMTNAILTGAPLHIVHINSATLSNISIGIEMVQAAQQKGYNITTELYPYPAGSTALQSAVFDEGWQKRLGISYEDLQWVATGERLTKETFESYRKTGGIVVIYNMKPEWIKAGIASKGTIIASDGMTYAKLAHPRTAGTFSRVLGKYVREEKVIDLNTAIEKMTLLPAKRLEGIAPMMRFKGRIQVGSDADITIFNPDTIIDKATFEKGLEFSAGIEYVMVNGSFVLRNSKTVSNVFPGQAVYGKFKK
ncbi:MAG: D-glutamate deacylase [Bacteroidetes bacterium]|nr:MAG: D-glutamate deacylase [Bacteroidota bacterium]